MHDIFIVNIFLLYFMKKELTTISAKKLALNISEKIFPLSQRDFFLEHSKKVVNVWKYYANHLGFDEDFFEIAWRVHDIWYCRSIDNHAKDSYQILLEDWYNISEELKDCVLNHWTYDKPETEVWKIFQIVDKLSIFDFNIIKIMIEHHGIPVTLENTDFLKFMSDSAIKLLQKHNGQ